MLITLSLAEGMKFSSGMSQLEWSDAHGQPTYVDFTSTFYGANCVSLLHNVIEYLLL